MIRLLLLLLTLALLPLPAMAEAPFTFADDITGMYTWPEGASEAEASYVYRYTYPQIAGDSTLAMNINEVFRYDAADALAFECPMYASDHPAELGQMQVELTYEITHLSSEALSVRIDKTVTVGESVSRTVKAYTFKLTGALAGTVTSLPYLLELVTDNSADEWLIDRQIAKADACVRDMVWVMIEDDMDKPDSLIEPDRAEEEFEYGFYPEEDFFLDEEGNFVFFIQEGVIAPFEAGQFFYTITLEDLLDEL